MSVQMRGYLNNEIRLQISVTRLKNSAVCYRLKIKEQCALLKQKDKKIAELEGKLTDKESQRKELLTFLYKPNKKDREKKPLGKVPGSPAYHRQTPKESLVTQEHMYTLKKCPICYKGVGKTVDTVVKYTEDIALKPPPEITKYTITRHWCGHCETYVKSPNVPPISRIGVKTLGYVLYSRYRLRLPFNKIQESLLDLYDFKISEGEIVNLLKDAESLFGKDHKSIIALIQNASVVYADETGWRMNGKNWFLWVFVTATGTQYIIEDTRGGGVPKRVLGDKEDRVIISDGYAVYKKISGDKQQCWVHLLRKAKLHSVSLYGDLAVLYKKLLLELEKPLEQRNRKKFEDEFQALVNRSYPEPEVSKVKVRMNNHKASLFTCIDYVGVLPENNTAERAIRPQVVMRKIFGGSRSLAGVRSHEVNTSVLETVRRQNPDTGFFEVVLPLLGKRRSGL